MSTLRIEPTGATFGATVTGVRLEGDYLGREVECTADDGCPTGYTCRKIASGSQIVGSQCMPKNLQCSQ